MSLNILQYMKDHLVYLDGGMGTQLQAQGLQPGELPERWNVTHPEVVQKIHQDYFDAGSNVVMTNTFGANLLKYSEEELWEVVRTGVNNARAAQQASTAPQAKFVALDIGPTGKMLKPYGDFEFEKAVDVFARTVKMGAACGVDLIMIETMSDSYETKAALLAAKENSDLPVFVCNAFNSDGKLMTGADADTMVAMLEGMGADAIGINCSMGPKESKMIIRRYLKRASIPVIFKPNAGLPKEVDGQTVYDITAEQFASEVADQVDAGVRIAGGCCGTTTEHISELVAYTKGQKPVEIEPKDITCATSYAKTVEFGGAPVLIGERINPTGKPRLKNALLDDEIDYVLSEGIDQQERGAHVLDVNVGVPDLDEAATLANVVFELQAVLDLPLQIDTANPEAMERALRRYNGKAIINSVNGKEESMAAIFPLVKKYGGLVVALTLDESGIPDTVEGRVDIARKILERAAEYGIDKKDIIFDPLTLTISADPNAAKITLGAVEQIHRELGCHTTLGVSNVSFGLPSREGINSTFFSCALGCGLSAAIMNPRSEEMMHTYYAYCALCGYDENCENYIAKTDPDAVAEAKPENAVEVTKTVVVPTISAEEYRTTLRKAIVKGRKEQADEVTRELLKLDQPLDIVQEVIIPALDEMGQGFEGKTVFLPQLLVSAEAAKAAFECIRVATLANGGEQIKKCPFILATVQGDIHDIGKNIVKLLLENYGFEVTDLGKDVPPEVIMATVMARRAPLVGLSALMTTTVPAMEDTIDLLKMRAPWCKVIVGGAVLNEEYATRIGADHYAKDAMETVRYAEAVFSGAV